MWREFDCVAAQTCKLSDTGAESIAPDCIRYCRNQKSLGFPWLFGTNQFWPKNCLQI